MVVISEEQWFEIYLSLEVIGVETGCTDENELRAEENKAAKMGAFRYLKLKLEQISDKLLDDRTIRDEMERQALEEMDTYATL